MEYVEWFGFVVDATNLPLKRPGMYELECLDNGKVYVGISQNIFRRGKGHAKAARPKIGRPKRVNKVTNALRKHGANRFVFRPIAYSIDGMTDWLPIAEASRIAERDSVRSGYNTIEASEGVGPYGPEFAAAIRAAHADPEVRARVLAANTSDERRAKQSAAIRAYFAENPEAATAFAELQRRLWADPEYRAAMIEKRSGEEYEARRRDAMRAAWADPELKARFLAIVADPDYQRRRGVAIRASYAAPGGKDKLLASRTNEWREKQRIAGRARFADPAAVERARAAQAKVADRHAASLRAAWADRPRIWITDGVTNRHHFVVDPVPLGWKRGRTVASGTPRGPYRKKERTSSSCPSKRTF